jgi:SulP family sulfate permease
MGVIQFVLGIFGMGILVNFLAHPVIAGFTNAAAIIIVGSQLDELFGVPSPGPAGFFQGISQVSASIASGIHAPTVIMSCASLAVLLIMQKFNKRIPGVLIVVTGATVVSWLTGFEKMGGSVIGNIPQGLPSFKLPVLNINNITQLFSGAFAIALLGFLEAITIAKSLVITKRVNLDANQELVGQGMANIAGSFFQGYPVSGSFARSHLNASAGGVTNLSSIISGIITGIVLLWLTPILYHLPKTVLAVVIITAIIKLIKPVEIYQMGRIYPPDGAIGVITFLLTLAFAPQIDHGVLIGVGLGLMLYVYRTMSPRIAILGRQKDGAFHDAELFNLPLCDEISLIRFDGSLYFVNAAYFESKVLERVVHKPKLKYVVIVGDGINNIDASGHATLRELTRRLKRNGMVVLFAGFKTQVLEVIKRGYFFRKFHGEEFFFGTNDQCLQYIWEQLGEDHKRHCPLYLSSNVEDLSFRP